MCSKLRHDRETITLLKMDGTVFLGVIFAFLIEGALSDYCVYDRGYYYYYEYCTYGCCDNDCCPNLVGIIVGGIIGGIFFISAIVLVVCLCMKHKSHSGRVIQPAGVTTISGTHTYTTHPTVGGYGNPYAQPMGQPYGQPMGQPYGQPMGQPYGQPPPYPPPPSYQPPSGNLNSDPAFPPGQHNYSGQTNFGGNVSGATS